MILVMMFVLILLQIKHWYIDFVNQTEEEVKHKGIYLDWIGIKHSAKHGVATFVEIVISELHSFGIILDWIKWRIKLYILLLLG